MTVYDGYSGATMFLRQSKLTPERPALIFRNHVITYGRLAEETTSLAWKLATSGVKQGDIVGLMMDRSEKMIVSLYAIWLVGAAYVPIDPMYPEERKKRMLEESDARWTITDEGLTSRRIPKTPSGNSKATPSHRMAYLIYTSGSTGNPKGVMVGHDSIYHFIEGVSGKLELEKYRSILALTTISFDIFLLEVVVALSKGLQVILASSEELRNPRAISALISQYNIEVVQMTPSRLTQLLNDRRFGTTIRGVRVLLIGGERIPGNLIHRLRGYTDATLYNMYGPTEATVWCAVYPIIGDEAVVGGPIGDTELLVMCNGRIARSGEEGELCIAGKGLAIGYWKSPRMNEDKFIPHPYREGARIYKTGDLAVLREDGTILIRGRLDDQVKIKGNRLELGEVEQCLLGHPTIRNAAILAVEGEDGSMLVAYYTGGALLSAAVYRDYLATYLPEYMLPSKWVPMGQLPLTPAGKVDRAKLRLVLQEE